MPQIAVGNTACTATPAAIPVSTEGISEPMPTIFPFNQQPGAGRRKRPESEVLKEMSSKLEKMPSGTTLERVAKIIAKLQHLEYIDRINSDRRRDDHRTPFYNLYVRPVVDSIDMDLLDIADAGQAHWPAPPWCGPTWPQVFVLIKRTPPQGLKDIIQGFRIVQKRLETGVDRPATPPVSDTVARPAPLNNAPEPDEPENLSGPSAMDVPQGAMNGMTPAAGGSATPAGAELIDISQAARETLADLAHAGHWLAKTLTRAASSAPTVENAAQKVQRYVQRITLNAAPSDGAPSFARNYSITLSMIDEDFHDALTDLRAAGSPHGDQAEKEWDMLTAAAKRLDFLVAELSGPQEGPADQRAFERLVEGERQHSRMLMEEMVSRVNMWAASPQIVSRFRDRCLYFDAEVVQRGDRIVHHLEGLRDQEWGKAPTPGSAPLGLVWHKEGTCWILRPAAFAIPIPHPLEWLHLPRTGPYGPLVESCYGEDSLPYLPDSDALSASYVLMAIFHAWVMRGNPRVRPLFDGIWTDEDGGWIAAVHQRIADGQGDRALLCWLDGASRSVEADLRGATSRADNTDLRYFIKLLREHRAALDRKDREQQRETLRALREYVGSVEQAGNLLRGIQRRCQLDDIPNVEQAINYARNIQAGHSPDGSWFWKDALSTSKVIDEVERATVAIEKRKEEGETKGAKPTTQTPPASGAPPKPYTFGPNYRSANWYGQPYTFSPTQAPVVSILAEAYEANMPNVDAAALLGLSNDEREAKGKKASYAKRVRDIFRSNPAWGKMIVPGKGSGAKGTYCLNPPQAEV